MLKKALNKLSAKLSILAMVVMTLAPLAGIVEADDTSTLRVGVNDISVGGFSVFRTDDLINPVLTSADCMPFFDTDGYYCTQYNQPIGSYVAFFNETPIGYTFSVIEDGIEQEHDPADNSVAVQLETEGLDMLGIYEVIPVIEDTGTIRVGVNNLDVGGFSVFRTDDLVIPILTSASCMPFFDTDGYYCTQYNQPIGSYVVFFNETPIGYTFSVTEDGIEQEHDPADNSVAVQLGTEGLDMLGIYEVIPVIEDTGTIRVGVNNLDVGGFSVFRTDDLVTPVLTSVTCALTFDVDGYYCTLADQPTGSYVVFFNETPEGFTFSVTEDGIEQEHDPTDNSVAVQLGTEGLDMLGIYEIIPVIEDTGTIRVGVNNLDIGGFSVFRTDDLVTPILTSVTCALTFDVDGYYCTLADQPTGSYVVFFNETPEGFTFSVTEDGIEQEHDPTDNSVAVQLGTEGLDMLGIYEIIPTDESYIEVTVTGPVTLTAAEISVVEDSTTTTVVDQESIDNGTSQTYTVNPGEAHTVTCHSVTGFDPVTPTINVAGITAGETESVICDYTASSVGDDDVDFVITAEDEEGAAMNVDFTYDTGTGTTSENVEVDIAELDDFTISFSDVPGYITPEDTIVTSCSIDTIPAGVTITINDADYVAGTEIQENDTIGILGTYEDKVSVSKTTVEESIVNNNKRVDYTITITRNPRDTSTLPLTISLHDTLSDTSGTLTGSSGGTMTAVIQGSDYSICSFAPCGDIVIEDFDISIASPGDTVTITYQLLSNNSGIPTGSSSMFTNTVTATYDDDVTSVETTNSAQVTVSAQPAPPGPTPTGGGGGGGGGGTLMITGDMILQIEKLVSLDNTNFKDASNPSNPLGMPENSASVRVYNKVRITNLGKVSATDVVFSESFDPGDSGMSGDDIENLKGASMNSDGDVEIEKITVNDTVEFTYSVLVRNTGNNGELANEPLTLEDFGSALPSYQDHLTYLGIGDEYPSYLVAGDVKIPVASGDERLRITVTSDKSEANIGDIVNLTITIENLTEDNITGLILTHDYPENALEILNSDGGRDNGRDVQWQLALLRSGEEATYQVQAKVTNSAPIGEYVRGLTRALVNEFEGVSPVENSLYILGAVQPAQTGVIQLAQTGPAQIFLLLIAFALAFLAYKESWRLRYAYVKKQALRPL